MKKIGLIIKETSENRIKDSFKSSRGLFVVKYSGVSGPDLSSLRKSLKSSGAQLLVVKNTVAKRAMKSAGLEELVKSVEEPCGIIFFKDEPVDASKVLCLFRKEHEQLRLESGWLDNAMLAAKDIEAMSRIPSRDILRAQLVGTLNAPIRGFVVALSQTLKKFVYCLDQIKQKKSA